MKLGDYFEMTAHKQKVVDALHILGQIQTSDPDLATHILDAEQALRKAQTFIQLKSVTFRDENGA